MTGTLEKDAELGRLALPGGTSVAILIPRDAADFLARSLAEGSFELEGQLHWPLIQALLPESGVFLDLGAHLGLFSLMAAQAGCRVIAVEPHPLQAAYLRASADLNGFGEFRVVQAAVADYVGSAPFHLNGPWSHLAAGQTEDDHLGPEVVETPVITVDDLLDALAVDHVDVVKMDLEGCEPSALRGMSRLLGRADSPPVIYEVNGDRLAAYGESAQGLRGMLSASGRWTLRIGRGTLTPVAPDSPQPLVLSDELACKYLPVGLPGWAVRPPQSRDEVLAEVLLCSESPFFDLRRHVARELRLAPGWLRANPRVETALSRLAADPDPKVAAAAAWWAQPSNVAPPPHGGGSSSAPG